MLRIWGKLWVKGRMKESITVEDEHTLWPLEKRIARLEDEIAQQMDLPRPIWLPKNYRELEVYGTTKFDQDNFIETFPYQSLEIQIIEKDDEDIKAQS